MMGDFSLEFIDPSELDEIKMGLETGIQENERVVWQKQELSLLTNWN